MYLESKPSDTDSSRKISKSLCYECQVRGSFCERSEELDGMQYIPLFVLPAVLGYLGHSEEGAGNWGFKDGTISFQEIFNLYRKHCPGKHISIITDCCYSGHWTIDCAKTLDSLGIPPCGRRARDQGILINASCQPDRRQLSRATL